MIFKSKAANELMADYDESGVDEIIENYTLEQLGEMVQPQEDSKVNVLLGTLMLSIQMAQKFRETLSELYKMWDADEWEDSQYPEELEE